MELSAHEQWISFLALRDEKQNKTEHLLLLFYDNYRVSFRIERMVIETEPVELAEV